MTSALASPRMIRGPLLSWASQAVQYPRSHEPGFRYTVETVGEDGLPEALTHPIDCLLWYDRRGVLRGILNRYPRGVPPYEVPMAINIWVHPNRQRQGIGRRLLAEAERLWGPIDWHAQRFSEAGLKLAEAHLRATRKGDWTSVNV